VVGADEAIRPALLRATHRIAAVHAGIEQYVDLAGAVAHRDHLILADVAHEEAAALGQLRFVAHEVPRPREDPFELLLVDVVVGEDPAIQNAGVGVEPRRAAGRDQRSGHGVPSQCLLPGGKRTRGEGNGLWVGYGKN
jgi:hypothetical protein